MSPSPRGRAALAESRQPLWRIALPPVIWGAHFLACYGVASLWCARFAPASGALAPARWSVAALTALALLAIAWNAWWGLRAYRLTGEEDGEPYPAHAPPPRHRDTPLDRHRFLGWTTLLLSGLAAVATLYVGAAALFVARCF